MEIYGPIFSSQIFKICGISLRIHETFNLVKLLASPSLTFVSAWNKDEENTVTEAVQQRTTKISVLLANTPEDQFAPDLKRHGDMNAMSRYATTGCVFFILTDIL